MSVMPTTPACSMIPHEGNVKAMTLADCVPWLETALEFIDGGPAGLSIEAVERYRASLMEILQHIRSTVEREAKLAAVH
jgi:hypothetical protein